MRLRPFTWFLVMMTVTWLGRPVRGQTSPDETIGVSGAPPQGSALTNSTGPTDLADVRVRSVWDLAVKGGPVMIPIGLCSLLALTVFVERLISLRRSVVIPQSFLTGLRPLLSPSGDRTPALALCQASDTPIARILREAIRRHGGPHDVLERMVREAGDRAMLQLRKHLRLLSVIAAVAPLLGLLGTIFGMIDAFQTVAASADALGRTELLARGIYEAMITTAAGLLVTIPTLIGYHGITARVEHLLAEMNQITVEILDQLDALPSPPTAGAATLQSRSPLEHRNEPVDTGRSAPTEARSSLGNQSETGSAALVAGAT